MENVYGRCLATSSNNRLYAYWPQFRIRPYSYYGLEMLALLGTETCVAAIHTIICIEMNINMIGTVQRDRSTGADRR